MNYSQKNKRRFTGIFLSGYILLLVYSSFHCHKIDLNVPSQFITGGTGAASNQSNDVVYSSQFTCQFNLVYNSSFTFNYKSFNLIAALNVVEFLKINKSSYIPKGCAVTLKQLRAPPTFS